MEFVPRITRAQVMDALSSQANLAGYRAVIEAAEAYGRALPMMMTAAGTVAAAKVFIMGVGVAGLQAIATARRLGAVVTATDVRPADQGTGREPGRQVPRRRGRGIQERRDRRRLRQGDERRIPGQAGRPGLRAHQEAGRRHHHRPDPRPPGAQAGLGRAGGLDEAGFGAGRPGGRTGRQRGRRAAGRDRRRRRGQDRRLSQPGRAHRRRRLQPLRPQPARPSPACCWTRTAPWRPISTTRS